MVDQYEAERIAVHGVLSAGNNARRVEKAIVAMQEKADPMPLLSWLARDDGRHMESTLRAYNCSRDYGRSTRALLALSKFDLFTCTLDDLLGVYGVGNKTARFILTNVRPDECQYAVLDTHVLLWLSEQGVKVPASTPSSPKRYRELEQEFARMAEARGITMNELDSLIYESRRK